jgi:hypothetical protein
VATSAHAMQSDVRDLVSDIVRDWGTGLEVSLYEQAVIQQLGVEEVVATLLPMTRDGNFLGNQRFHLIDSDSAFTTTAFAFSDDFSLYLRRLELNIQQIPCSGPPEAERASTLRQIAGSVSRAGAR